ncbi:MAG TPA: peptidoglycan-binding domain-containing protein [Methylovirgula sp.]|nr:peptidoglycan-binding domain-containing protein [Methylovirgula sp.]
MRDVLDRVEPDFDLAAPARRGRSKKAQQPQREPAPLRFLQLIRHAADYPNRVAGTLLVGIVVAICINALVLQRSRHPAPLFHTAIAAPLPPALPAARHPAVLRAMPEKSDLINQILSSPLPPQRPGTEAGESEAKASRDPIGQLLKSDTPEPSKTVLAAQRALVKLGFVLKPDGILGTATREAVEQFERDHGFAVSGTLTPKVLHELSAQSGIAVD